MTRPSSDSAGMGGNLRANGAAPPQLAFASSTPRASLWPLLLLALAALHFVVCDGRVYIGPDSSYKVWDGDCSTPLCTALSPCRFNSSRSSHTITGSGPCSITIQNGTYNASAPRAYLYGNASSSLSLDFSPGLVSNLKLSIYFKFPVHVNGSGALLYNSILQLAPNASLTIDQLRLYNSSCDASPTYSTLTISDCAIRNSYLSMASLYSGTVQRLRSVDSDQAMGGQLTILDSYIEGDNFPAVIPPDNSGAFPPQDSFGKRDGSRASSTRPAKLFSTRRSPLTSKGKRSSLDSLQTPPEPSSTFIGCIWNRTSIMLHNLVVENTLFINTLVESSGWANWTGATFIQHVPDKYVKITSSLPAVMRDVTFLNPNRHPSSNFSIYSDNVFTLDTSSNTTISDLYAWNATEVRLGDLEITNTLFAANLDTPPIIRPLGSNTTWNWHSIDIGNVVLEYGELGHLIYTPSVPSKGISVVGPTHALSPLPQRLSIDWNSQIPPPTYLTVYPLANFARMSGDSQISLSAPFSPFPLLASFGNDSTTLLTYRSYSFPQPQLTCSNPPPGFICSPGGTLYAPGPVDQPSITIPAQSGNVVVIGNVTVGSGVTFVGTGSTLTVIGCANIGGDVTLEVDPGKLPPKGSVTLITQSEECDAVALNTIPVKLRTPKASCKRVSAQADSASSKSQLTALFVVDSSKCNVKWIILGAVLGGAVIIVVVSIIAVKTFISRQSK